MRAYWWLALVIGLITLLFFQLQRPQPFSSNILDLLPNTEQDEVVGNAINTFSIKVGQKVLFLVGADERERAKKAAEVFHQSLQQSNVFTELVFKIDESQQKEVFQNYFPYRYHLLSKQQRQQLKNNNGDEIIQQALRQLYSPMLTVNSELLIKDPLFLFTNYMSDLPSLSGNLQLDDELLMTQDEQNHYVLMVGWSPSNAFAKSEQQALLGAITLAEKNTLSQIPTAQFISSGLIKHAHAGRKQGEREISTIGLGSLLGVIILIWFSFRSIAPLGLSLLAIGCGITCALAVSLLVFEQLHLLTLVFGASLIGVSIDYSFHYFSDRVMSDQQWTAQSGLKRIMPGITLGLITSIFGYLGLLIAPFPGLQQMAVFSSVGLLAAYATVVCWFPLFTQKPSKQSQPWLIKPALVYLNYWREMIWTNSKRVIAGALIVFFALGVAWLKPNDDIRLLQHAQADLVAHDQKIQALTQQTKASQFFLVEGENFEQLLQNEEVLSSQLEILKAQKAISSFQSISTTLPSQQKQQENYQWLKQQLVDNGLLESHLAAIGFSEKDIAAVLSEFTASRNKYFNLANWQNTALGHNLSYLWLGKTERGVASIVLLSGVNDLSALAQLENTLSQVTFIDIAGDVSKIFERYRVLVIYLVLLSYGLIFLLLNWRYGWSRAWVVILPPIVAALASMAWFGWTGQLFNLFNVLALIIVMAIGIDYTLFFEESHDHSQATMLAILLSAITTLLSFGLLALSATPAISAFGQTMLIGIGVAFLLSPFVYSVKKQAVNQVVNNAD